MSRAGISWLVLCMKRMNRHYCITCRAANKRKADGADNGVHFDGIPLQAAGRARQTPGLQVLLVLCGQLVAHLRPHTLAASSNVKGTAICSTALIDDKNCSLPSNVKSQQAGDTQAKSSAN